MSILPSCDTDRSVAAVDPRTDPRWAELATGSCGSLFTSPPWISAVCGSYGFTPRARLVLDDGGHPLAGVATVELSDLRGDRIVSLPFSDRADPLGDPSSWAALVESVISPHAPWSLRCLDGEMSTVDPQLRVAQAVAWHGTPLDADLGEIRDRLSGTARRNLGVASRSGVRIEPRVDPGAVRQFHQLHVRLRKNKYRMLAQPLEFFERIHDQFRRADSVVTMLAEIDGEVVAGALFLQWNDVLYYKFGASSPEHLRARPNDAIYWEGIQWALAHGLREIDWGISDLDQPGLIGFKDKWATRQRRVVTLRAGGERAATAPPVGGLLAELTELLTDPSVPDEISARAGDLLYRQFA